MKNMTLGYARVSTDRQELLRQLDALTKYGIPESRIFTEKMTGTKRDRKELNKLLERLEEGDTLVIESLSRLGRSTLDLLNLINELKSKGVTLVSLKENIDTDTPTGVYITTTLSALSQFERDITVMRCKEGLVSARQRGRIGGRPRKSAEQLNEAVKLYSTSAYTLKEIKERTTVCPNTLYAELRRREKADINS